MTIFGDDFTIPVHSTVSNIILKQYFVYLSCSLSFLVIAKSKRLKKEALRPLNRAKTRYCSSPSLSFPNCSRDVAFEFIKQLYPNSKENKLPIDEFTPGQLNEYCKLAQKFLDEDEVEKVKSQM